MSGRAMFREFVRQFLVDLLWMAPVGIASAVLFRLVL